MPDAVIKRIQTWSSIGLFLLATLALVKASGASDKTIQDHERRLQILEAKFEKAMEVQANMAGDIRVIRAIIEQRHKE